MPNPLRGPMLTPDRVLPVPSSGSGVVQFELVHGLVPIGASVWTASGSASALLDPVLSGLAAISAPHPTRVYAAFDPGQIEAWEALATGSALPPARSLNDYWQVDLRATPALVAEVLALLQHAPGVVVVAWEVPNFRGAAPTPSDDPLAVDQTHLDAGTGIDARYAWTVSGGDGAGIRWMSLEEGCYASHEDLVGPVRLAFNDGYGTGYSPPDREWHGTAVTALVSGLDNALGGIGIAPAAQCVGYLSPWGQATVARSIGPLILASLAWLLPGDVLLIELQWEDEFDAYPIELTPSEYDAIRLVSALGVAVVEPAANGGVDFDTHGTAKPRLGAKSGLDSGALMVGAAFPSNFKPLSSSGHGARVDFFAAGDGVVTAGSDSPTPSPTDFTAYTKLFGKTSAAAAIVAGAALLAQGHYAAGTGGGRLTPLQLRGVLKVGGTPSLNGAAVDRIGVMPNLKSVFGALGLLPDVYVRDYVGDAGDVPASGIVCRSPDIIVRQAPVANPQAAFGEGSGTEGLDNLGVAVETGLDHRVFVRVRNRGGTSAATTATVYYAEPSTLPTPAMWTLIGTTGSSVVPADDKLYVLPVLSWPKGSLPSPGHYCFVAVLDAAGDPAAPALTTLSMPDFATYVALVTDNNGVAWRNFSVLSSFLAVPLKFSIAGAPDAARTFDLSFVMRVPKGTRVRLWMPIPWAKVFRAGYGLPYQLVGGEMAIVLLPESPVLSLGGLKIPRDLRIPMAWILEGPASEPGDTLSVRQYYERRLIGAVHWRVE